MYKLSSTEQEKPEQEKQEPLNSSKKGKILLTLFFSTFYISAFTFGGGYVIVTFMKRKFVDELHWINEDEMLDFVAIAQSCPGAIAVNASIMVGWRVAGFVGMLTAVLGTIIPPMLIITVLSFFYKAFAANRYVSFVLKGMQAGVAAVILDVVCDMGLDVIKQRQAVYIVIMVLAFIATFFMQINVIYIILFTAVFGILLAFWKKKRGERV